MNKYIRIAIFCIFVFGVIFKDCIDRKENRVALADFRADWNTQFIATIRKKRVVTNDAGLLWLDMKTIEGDYDELEDYEGGEFYFMSDGKTGYLVEGGLSEMSQGDIVQVTKSGGLIIINGDQTVILRQVFYSSNNLFWKEFNRSISLHGN